MATPILLRPPPTPLPAGRDRAIDLFRTVGIAAVVLGHWLVIGIDSSGGHNLLETGGWIHPLTWLFQVMPLVFIVAGWSNARSWPTGGPWRAWYRRRAGGFAGPVLVYLVGVQVVATIAGVAGVDGATVGDAAWLARVHLWFVPVYLAVMAVTPLAVAAARRWGTASVVTLVAASIVLDVGRPSVLTWATVWLACHQLGVAWGLGSVPERQGVRLAAVAGAAAVALVLLGPWPLSMVGVPGTGRGNTAPPSIALLALGLAQGGVAMGAAPAVRRWLAGSPPAAAVVERWGARSARLYLLHLLPVLTGALVLRLGLVDFPPVDTAAWWALRPLWLGAMALGLAALLATGRHRGGAVDPDSLESCPSRPLPRRATTS